MNEVGCIHTTQGYDLNYAGIILGNEISYDDEKNEIVILKENYKDPTGRQTNSADQLKTYIINIYKTMMLRGIKGTYLYACDPKLRDYLSKFIPIKEKQKTVPVIEFIPDSQVKPFENSIPVYPLDVAAGKFGEHQEVSDVDWIKPPDSIRITEDHFVCRIVGESMNKIIPNGSYAVFRKYHGGSRNGEIVLVEHTDLHDSDFGSCYTIKEYQSEKFEDEEGWKHSSITLKPRSTEKFDHLTLKDDELSRFRVIGVFECVLK